MKVLLPLERYPLRRGLHHVNFNYSVFFEGLWLLSPTEPLSYCSAVYCDFDEPPPLIFLSLSFEICHNSLTSLKLQLNFN